MSNRFQPFIVVAGQYPPPVNGFAYITQEVTRALSLQHETAVIDLAPHTPNNGAPYHMRRLALTLKGLAPLFNNRKHSGRMFYLACEGGFGLTYTIILAVAARMLGYQTYIHHHSFAYIDSRRILMRVLLAVLGSCATHIFLSPLMASRFASRYSQKIKTIVLSNSAFVSISASPVQKPSGERPLTIGLLSNLNNEKGLGLFLETLRVSIAEGLNVHGILAGPPVSEADRKTIELAREEFGNKLDYRGPVYGEEKIAFFKSVNVFVFPTQYANEAQPTVIFEAMAEGIPVISYDRGCIKEQVGPCGLIIPKGEEFISSAVRWLKAELAAPDNLAQLTLDTRSAFHNDQRSAKEVVTSLFKREPKVLEA